MKLETLIEAFADGKYPLKTVPHINALAIYDDENFAAHDFDIIGPKPRKHFAKMMKDLGFTASGSRNFKKDGLTLQFHRPQGTLGVHPMVNLTDSLTNGESYYILTPTEAVLALLLTDKDFLESELVDFVYSHPINFDKIKKWSKAQTVYVRYLEMVPSLKASQRQGIEDRKSGILKRLRRESSSQNQVDSDMR
ncbi:hypothetical protein N9D31_00465 [Oligoflexaceae bacterium]|nr:hypothetical protein [Oligoflexaceae bacterium]